MKELTPKQKLETHIFALHKRPPSGMTLKELQAWHAGQHHKFWTDHYHDGVNLGPDQRPSGWKTGEGAVPKSGKLTEEVLKNG